MWHESDTTIVRHLSLCFFKNGLLYSLFLCISVVFLISNYQSLKVIPERAAIIYFNKSFFEDNISLNVRRYNRKGDYYTNAFFESKVVISNTATLDVIFYEYLHNEFRRSFPEMHYKVCDFINNDPYIGNAVRQAGLTSCPVQPGKHDVRNISFNQKIPSVWPFEKGMIEFIVKNPNDVLIGKVQLVVTYKQDLLKNKI